MNLTSGQRLTTGTRSAYEVVAPSWSTSEHEYFRARKVFWNYRERDRSLYEADPAESLEVLIRVPRAGFGAADVTFELDHVLGAIDVPWFPDPIDVIPGPQPLLVLAHSYAGPLSATPGRETSGPRLRLARELLMMLASLHERDLVMPGLIAEDLRIGDEGRWWSFGSWRVRKADAEHPPSSDLARWGNLCAPWVAAVFPETDTAMFRVEAGGDIRRISDMLRGARSDAADPSWDDDLAWVVERLVRLGDGPGSAAELMEEPGFWDRTRRFFGGRRG